MATNVSNPMVSMKFMVIDQGEYVGLPVHVNQAELIAGILQNLIAASHGKLAVVGIEYRAGNQLWFTKMRNGGLKLGTKISKNRAITPL